MKTQKKILTILIIGILIIFITPFVFTRSLGLIDFSNTGDIGDTIGGITAPFVSLLGSILVYYALKAQIDANALIQEQLNEQKTTEHERKIVEYLSNQLEIIRNDIENFEYTESTKVSDSNGTVKTTKSYNGSEAIFKFLELYQFIEHNHETNPYLGVHQFGQLQELLNMIDTFLYNVGIENISTHDKKYLTSTLKYLYLSKLKPHFDSCEKLKSTNLGACTICNEFHNGIPEELYESYYSINEKLQYNHR